ncbi:hypothetical protein [Flexistipes sp.]|uniref:hypothetical protein n=1 Tax=Flexistipes sp. TaxID=3088135 RepID=UPI002E21D3C9|nr:hypothetical protein [Flexistipes sp.]
MGLVNGSLTFFRLFYNEKVEYSLTDATELLKEYSFDRFYDSSKPLNYGFVPLGYPEVSDFESAELLFDNTFIFTVRIDEKKISKKFFDIKFEEMKNDFLKQNNKEYLSKSDKDFIKNALTNKMHSQAYPATTLVEVIWEMDNKEIFISSLTNKTFESVVHLFRAAFEVNLFRDSLMETVKRKISEPYKIDDLKNVAPTGF